MNSNNPNEQSGSPRDSRNPAINSGLSVGSQVNVGPVKPVDHKALEGTNPGDHRSKGADAKLPANPGPREQMGQFPLSGRTPAAPAPMTTVDETEVGG